MKDKKLKYDGREVDWGKTSADYRLYRPGYPDSFYDKLAAVGIGLRGQRILDLGTGTGGLARNFARRGCTVTGVDISENQISAAQQLAQEEKLDINFFVSAAESTQLPDKAFDVITAGSCWLYFDKSIVIPEVKRLLASRGFLMTCTLVWLPYEDMIAHKTEELILRYNPHWTGAGFTFQPEIHTVPEWSLHDFHVTSFHKYRVPIEFTRESWRGRMRTCRGVGASLSQKEIEKFDKEHAQLLNTIADEKFNILHLIWFHVFQVKNTID
jgi:cyclopropane fatty-acyl-phospholipid synthase-like methyltransferase